MSKKQIGSKSHHIVNVWCDWKRFNHTRGSRWHEHTRVLILYDIENVELKFHCFYVSIANILDLNIILESKLT